MSQAEDQYWAGKLTDARHGQLDTVRKAATSWSALFTAVLGVFSAVTFATGLPGIDDLDETPRVVVLASIGVAALATLAATILAGLAANSVPRVTSDLSIASFQKDTKETAKRALNLLKFSMISGCIAAVVVVGGSIIMLFSDSFAKAPSPTLLISVVGGKAYCGAPTVGTDGTLEVNGVPLSQASSITVVSSCPKAP
ncbi:MAG TPA: hypothetical protein PKA89_09195 [Phycicoccus sp.]|nr:hypothetical protein [Phycicoccus sp.]